MVNVFSDINPYGLSGGIYLSGSMTISGSGNYFFTYYPIANSIANITMENISGTITGSFTAGRPIYGKITAVTQSSGIAFAYWANSDQVSIPTVTTGSVSFVGLLDSYPGAAAGYSLRKLSSTYSGSAIRVRRSSDNAEQDIGFNVSNTLDTTALLAFCGAGDGFVTTWYDQSGNSKDIGNTTAIGQPQIVSVGAVLLENTKPAMTFDGSNNDFSATFGTILNQPSTMFSVVRPLSLAGGSTRHLIDKHSAGQRQAVYMLLSNNIALFAGSSFDSGVAFTTTQQLITTTFNSTNSTVNRNSGATITGDAGTENQEGLRIGSNAGAASFFNMNLQEVVLYNSDQSSNISNIKLNLNTFYNIYP